MLWQVPKNIEGERVSTSKSNGEFTFQCSRYQEVQDLKEKVQIIASNEMLKEIASTTNCKFR